jgi:hypothetical protein
LDFEGIKLYCRVYPQILKMIIIINNK